ncbi:MAG: tetratricopeptide repeat protein, partial [Candidatus Scalindua sp.]|nr:tetratricopeptide repeat protein [Candidatus Scalindua sp.]
GIEQFKSVIEIKPDLDSAYLNLARAFVASGKTDEAFNTLEKAVSLNPSNVDTKIMLAGLYQRENKLNEAIKAFKNVLKIRPDFLPGYALAGLYFLNGEVDMSIDICNRGLRLDPDNSAMRIILAVSYQQKESYATAISSCQKAIELKPDIASFKLILSSIYVANGEHRKAKKQIESTLTINDGEKGAYLELLDLCLHNKEKSRQITFLLNKAIFAKLSGVHDIAINECRKAAAIFPDNILPRLILASTYIAAKQNEEAIEVYNEIKKSKPEFTSPYYDLARAYISSDKEDDAISTYQDLLDVDSESVSARLAISGLLLRKGSLDEAAIMAVEAIKLDPESVLAHNLSGTISLATTEYEKAETSFSKVIELRSDTFEGHYNMARTKFAQGEYDECIEHCNIALQIKNADVRVHNILGMAFLKKGMLGDAVAVFNKIIGINSDFVPAYINLAKINMSTRKPAVAAILYNVALKINPDAVEARFGLGNSLALMGKHTEAIGEFEKIIKDHPDSINTFNSMARSYMALKKFDKAQESVMSALDIKQENLMARSLLAMIHVEKESIPEAIKQLNRVLIANPEFAGAYGLAILYLDNGDFDNSISISKQGLEHYPENISLWCNKAVAYLLKGDYVNAKKSCREMLNLQPDGLIPNLCLVNTLLAEGAYDIAKLNIKNMEQLGEVNKTDYLGLIDFCAQNKDMGVKVSQHMSRAIAYTEAKWFKRALREYEAITRVVPLSKLAYSAQIDILIMIRQDDKAIEICKKVIALQPEFPDVYIKLAGIYNRNGQKDEAEALYRKVIAIDTENVTAYLDLGVLLESKELFDESIDSYKKAIELNSSSVAAYNNLAWVYASKKQGKLKEALKLAKKAKEIAPNSPAVVDTLGWVYYMNGLYDEATTELEAAVKGAMWNPTIRYHLGMAYYKKGLQRKSMTEMQRALKTDRTFPEADSAREIIDKIIADRIDGA